MKNRRTTYEPILGIGLLLFVVGGLTWMLREPPVAYVQGEIEATQVDLAVKIPGRVSRVLVREGQHVDRGDLLLMLDSPEIQARLHQAAAAEQAADAQRDKAYAGARRQEIQAAGNLWRQAREAALLAEKTFARVNRLFADGVVPAQRRDEAEAKWKVSREAAEAARAQYELAREGARKEDLRTAAALAEQASGAVSEVRSYIDETRLATPLDGEVAHVLADPGEVVAAGYPVVSIVDLTDVWAVFNVREDNLAGLGMGTVVKARVPALGKAYHAFRVSYVSVLGDFATWRSTSASGGFDLKTFEVHARPLKPLPGLRPGMSVMVPLSEIRHGDK